MWNCCKTFLIYSRSNSLTHTCALMSLWICIVKVCQQCVNLVGLFESATLQVEKYKSAATFQQVGESAAFHGYKF